LRDGVKDCPISLLDRSRIWSSSKRHTKLGTPSHYSLGELEKLSKASLSDASPVFDVKAEPI